MNTDKALNLVAANELRIGNIIYDAIGIVIEVDALSYEILSAKNSGTCRYEVTRGIPLTEEWLLKFGFEKEKENFVIAIGEDDSGFFMLKPARTLPSQKDFYAWWTYIGNESQLSPFLSCCSYVHQLQNLYFAITNSELKLK